VFTGNDSSKPDAREIEDGGFLPVTKKKRVAPKE
jgi:hypothetical protein